MIRSRAFGFEVVEPGALYRRPGPGDLLLGACRSNPLARPGGRLDDEQSAEDAEDAETVGKASGVPLSSVRC